MGAFIAGLSNIYLSGQKLKDAKMQKKKMTVFFLSLFPLFMCLPHIHDRNCCHEAEEPVWGV